MRDSVIILCTGNICRSPMGEALLRHAIGELPQKSPLKKLRVISAGTFGEDGCGATDNSLRALKAINVPLENHKAQTITGELLDSCYCLVAMTKNHLQTVQSRHADKMPPHALTLLSLDPSAAHEDVMDPWGYDMKTYIEVRDEIARAIPYLVKFLEKELSK